MSIWDRNRQDGSAGQWVADKIAKHDNVVSVTILAPNKIHVRRKKWGDVTIAAMSARRVDAELVDFLLSDAGDIDFVVNIPKAAYVIGNTYELAAERNFAFGGFGDLLSALNSESPRTFISSEFSFVLRSLGQHSKVWRVTRLDDRRLRVERNGLDPVVVLVLNDYELTADHVRNGIERYGEFQAIVCSNPNSRVTTAASLAADESHVRIFNWKEFFQELNRKWTWKK
jgi:hypothetical protein